MSSNIAATLGGRGLNSVVIRSTPDALSLRGELGSSTVPHKDLDGTGSQTPMFMNGNSMDNQVNSSDTAFYIRLAAGMAGTHQVVMLNTNYDASLVNNNTHKLVTTIIGRPTGNMAIGDSFGILESSFVSGSAAGTTDIVIIRKSPQTTDISANAGASGARTTLVAAHILVRLVRRQYVTST
jgi:hypothetical protein